MKFDIFVILILVFVVLAVVSAGLIAVWSGFGIFLGLFLLCATGIYTYISIKKYMALKVEIEEQRYCDAYIYADENNLNFDVANFHYSKKDERIIRRMMKNKMLPIVISICFAIFSIVIIYIGFTSVL